MKNKNRCKFEDHKEYERICKNCGYVIEKTPNDILALRAEIEFTGEKPKCDK